MVKSYNKTVGAIGILFMLCASSLSVTYSFAEIADGQEDKKKQNDPNIEKNSKKERLGTILTEKIINGKLEVQHYALPDDITEEDMHRMLSFEDQAENWAYVNYKAYNSGIVLFDGKVSKIGEGFWKISTEGILSPEERWLDITGEKSNDSQAVIPKVILDENLIYQVIFSGETYEENMSIVYLMNCGLNYEMDLNIQLSQIGEIIMDLEKLIESDQELEIQYVDGIVTSFSLIN